MFVLSGIGEFFKAVFYQPLFNLLILFCVFIPGQNLGWAIIALTVVSKILLYPSNQQALKSQKAMGEIQPLVQAIQKKYKDDKQKQAEEMLKLYKEKNFNPFSGFAPLLIQLPIFIALYQIFIAGVGQEQMNMLYSFVPRPDQISQMFLGLDLSKPNMIFAVAVGIAQYFQTKTSLSITPKNLDKDDKAAQFSSMMQNYTLYFFPVLTVMILAALPSAVGLYWMTTTIFAIGQNYLFFKKNKIQ